MAQIATNARFMVNDQCTGFQISPDGIDRADIGAIRIFALVADRWKVIEIFARMGYLQERPVRVVSTKEALGTGQLAQPASGTPVEIGLDETSFCNAGQSKPLYWIGLSPGTVV